MSSAERLLLIKLGATALAMFVIWRSFKLIKLPETFKFYGEVFDDTTEILGNGLADVTQSINGSPPVQLASGRFFLDEKYIASDGTIDRDWKKIMIKTHVDIESLFDEITDPLGRLKDTYQYLINGEVSQNTVYGSNAP